MDDEMIERCVKAVSDSMDITDGLDGTAAKTYVLACIKAMRKPTKKMKVVGVMTMPDYDPQLEDAEECWHQMIDAIIKDSK